MPAATRATTLALVVPLVARVGESSAQLGRRSSAQRAQRRRSGTAGGAREHAQEPAAITTERERDRPSVRRARAEAASRSVGGSLPSRRLYVGPWSASSAHAAPRARVRGSSLLSAATGAPAWSSSRTHASPPAWQAKCNAPSPLRSREAAQQGRDRGVAAAATSCVDEQGEGC